MLSPDEAQRSGLLAHMASVGQDLSVPPSCRFGRAHVACVVELMRAEAAVDKAAAAAAARSAGGGDVAAADPMELARRHFADLETLIGASWAAEFLDAAGVTRMVAVYISERTAGLSPPQIREFFGMPDWDSMSGPERAAEMRDTHAFMDALTHNWDP